MKTRIEPGPAYNQLKTALKNLDGKVGKTGWFPSAQYENGTPVAYVAAIQEFGCPERSIPARPSMRPTIATQEQAWRDLVEREAKKIIKGESTVEKLMELLGLRAEGDIRKTISKITTPPLSPVTLLLRKQRKLGNKITGKTVGEAYEKAYFIGPRQKKDKSASVAGVSTKPLVDTRFMINTLTSMVEDKPG